MIYYTTTYTDVVESFLLGLSCLVGGDQFYIFISQTDASPKTQSYIAITLVLSTLFLAIIFYDEYNPSLFDLFHLFYLIMLLIWISVLYQKVKDRFITTIYTSVLAMVLTFLIILSCIHYSHRKDLLPSFLSGLLFARLLPTLIWTFMKEKKPEYEDNLSTLSMRLALFRILFCMSSIMIKITSGTLDFSGISAGINKPYDWFAVRSYAFITLWEQLNKLFIYSYSIIYLIFHVTTFLLFFWSIVLYFGLPPILHKFSHLYSHHLYCTIDIMRTVSHLLGVALGTKYPVSKTNNSYYYNAIYFVYMIYVWGIIILNSFLKITSQILLHIVVIIGGLILGYVWSYFLGIIINTILNPTCLYEDIQGYKPCCGDKTESQCYCKLPLIISELNRGTLTCDSFYRIYINKFILIRGGVCGYTNRFSCSKSFKTFLSNESFNYHRYAPNAILLLYNGSDSSKFSCCNGECRTICTNGICKCLRIVGIYKVETVTTSTCENCQLTIRIEAKKTCCCKNGSCGDGRVCHCESETKCCCLAIRCCQMSSCRDNCSCVCLCCCNQCRSCLCKIPNIVNLTRLFICFENGGKCCIKEIRINYIPFFDGDLRKMNEFYIKNITFSDCCHTDLKVDLHCTMKNNSFRLTPINYKYKHIKPIKIALTRYDGDSCKTVSSPNCCCCENIALSKAILQYKECNCEQGKMDQSNCECCKEGMCCLCHDKICCKCDGKNGDGKCDCNKECRSPCGCCTPDKCCCCCKSVIFNVSGVSSFYQTIEPIRVKLVLILWFFFLIFLMITISTESKHKNKSLKYYQFFPIRSFDIVNKKVEKNNMNSMHTVLQRLRAAQEGIFLETFGEKEKKHDLDHMLELCSSVLSPSSFNRLKHYVLSQSSMLIASPQYVNRRLDLELVKWSYCVGFVYTYITLMFFRIQDYFLKWEYVWLREYLNYRKTITSKFNKITQTSKFSISLMCEVDVNHKTILYLNKTRRGNWGCAYDEIDSYTNLYDKEVESSKSPPYRMDLRLMYFIDRWAHRITSIEFWIQNKTNLYDWSGLMKEYPNIRNWFFNFRRHIEKTSVEVNPPVDALNFGTEILEGKVKA